MCLASKLSIQCLVCHGILEQTKGELHPQDPSHRIIDSAHWDEVVANEVGQDAVKLFVINTHNLSKTT